MDNATAELRHCISFFLDSYSRNAFSYGLVPDTYPTELSNIASIAGTGFLFPVLISAVEEKILSYSEAESIAVRTSETLCSLKKVKGWFYHFYRIQDGLPTSISEVSTIDSALLYAGLFAGAGYFHGKVEKNAKKLLGETDFPFFLQTYGNMFAMALERDGRIHGHWDRYAEQLVLYVLGAASPNEELRMDPAIYDNFIRDYGTYKNHRFICSWYGSLFTYQYSHAYIDFRGLRDRGGVDWFQNSVEASLAAYEYACDEEGKFKSFHRRSWGLTACSNQGGYSGRYGQPPCGIGEPYNDGTIAPCASIGSIVFTPEQSLSALDYMYAHAKLVRDYGLIDSYNEDTNFFCPHYLSIDKGISALMIENFLRSTIWRSFMSVDLIQKGLDRIGLKKG